MAPTSRPCAEFGSGREELDAFEDAVWTAFIGSSMLVTTSPHSTNTVFYKPSSESCGGEEEHKHLETEGEGGEAVFVAALRTPETN